MQRRPKDRIINRAQHGTKRPSDSSHRFQSFSDRISKLHIDPIRRTSRATSVLVSGDGSSHFRDALETWKDINISANFVEFVHKVEPLTQSLAQLLHHQGVIVEALLEGIEKHDALSSEPLLKLLADFAHDLGMRFESFFSRAVYVVTELAQAHKDVAVVEWAFNCLAWLFKYLHRLLVPDLRPTYDLLAPLLGKQPQKPYIARFAAESFSYLIRRAASQFDSSPVALQTILAHIFNDLAKFPQQKISKNTYETGIASLLTEAIVGPSQSIASSGKCIIKVMLDTLYNNAIEADINIVAVERSIYAVFSAIASRIDHESYGSIAVIVNDTIDADQYRKQPSIYISSGLLLNLTATKKGQYISDWKAILDRTSSILKGIETLGYCSDDEVHARTIALLAALLQFCPLSQLLLSLTTISTQVEWSLSITDRSCLFTLLGHADPERFSQLLSSNMATYVNLHLHLVSTDVKCLYKIFEYLKWH